MTRPNHNPIRSPGPARRLAAFTLIELLVVIAIILIILGVAMPVAGKLMKGNAQKQAVNTVTAYLASARATAMSSKRLVGAVFYTDPANKNQGAVQLVWSLRDDPATGNAVFSAIPDRGVEFLPTGIQVATLSGAGNLQFDTSTQPNTTLRIILFGPDGQMILRTGLANETNTQFGTGNTNWGFGTTGACSSPGVLIYDLNAFRDAISANAGLDRNQWLQKNADLLIVNAYTGNVIR